MNSVYSLLSLFNVSQFAEEFENFEELNIKALSNDITVPNEELIREGLESFPDRDKVFLDISIDGMDAISYRSSIDISNFLQELQFAYNQKYDDSEFELKVKIVKSSENNTVSVYSLDIITTFIETLSFKSLLFIFNKFITDTDTGPTVFQLLNDHAYFGTSKFRFQNDEPLVLSSSSNRFRVIEKHKELSNYLNGSENSLIPDDFFITGNAPVKISSVFNKLCAVLSLIFISDIAKVENQNDIYFRINGYKMIQEIISFKSIEPSSFAEFYKIYSWIYSEGNVSDKAGLARNIFSLNYSGEMKLSEETYASIRSGFEIYLKRNIKHYIDVKNKVSEFLINMSHKSSSIVDSFASSIKNNNFLFLSYFISIVMFNALSNKNIVIFTNEIESISYGILIISLIFLFVSLLYAQSEKKRYDFQYKSLKSMYTDILDENDLENIFRHDSGYNSDIKFVNQKIKLYSFLWASEIMIIGLTVFWASNPQFMKSISQFFEVVFAITKYIGILILR